MPSAEPKPRERIVDAVSRLFYRDGYHNTGIREIIAESETHKASLYNHFASKDDLVRVYLEQRGDILARALRDIAARAADARRFFRFWQGYLQQAARAGELHGCPLANLNAELGPERERFREELKAVGDLWLDIVVGFLRREQRAKRIPAQVDTARAGRSIMIVYEGYLQAYRLYAERGVLDGMAADMLRMLK